MLRRNRLLQGAIVAVLFLFLGVPGAVVAVEGNTDIETERLSNPPTDDRDAVIVLYCRTGSRSSYAERVLRRLGYSEIIDFGGVVSWPYALER